MTLWEEQGVKIVETLMNMDENMKTTKENSDGLKNSIETMNADPMLKIKDALNEMMNALQPLLGVVADLISKFATWASENPALTSTLMAIGTALGILTGAFAALMPAISGLIASWPAIVAAMSALTGPVGLVIAALVALGAGIALLWNQSDTFRTNMVKAFEYIKTNVSKAVEAVTKFIGEKTAEIKKFWDENGKDITKIVEAAFGVISKVIEVAMKAIEFVIKTVWEGIKNIIDGALKLITGSITAFTGLLTGDFSKFWDGIKTIFSGSIDLILGIMNVTFMGGIRGIITNLTKTVVGLIKTKWESIVGLFTSGVSNSVRAVKEMIPKMMTEFNSLKNNIISKMKEINLFQVGKDIISGLIRGISTMTSQAIEAITGVVDGVISKAKKLLGINSPSKLFKQFGEWTGEGYVIGLDKTVPDAENSSANLANAVINAQTSLANSGSQAEMIQGYQQQVVQQNTNIDLNSLVAAITQLANQPIMVQSILDGRIVSESVSRNQQSMYNLSAIAKGVNT